MNQVVGIRFGSSAENHHHQGLGTKSLERWHKLGSGEFRSKVFTARSEVLERILNESREVLVRFRGFWMCGKVSQVMKGSESIGFKVQEVKISRMDQDVKMFPESKCCDICLNIV